MSEKKKLSLDLLEEIQSSFSEQKEITVIIKTPNGEHETTVSIDKYFSPKKIDQCVKELIQKADYLKTIFKEKKDLKDILQLWMILLIIRNFSSLEIPFEFKKQLAVLEKLTQADILLQIFQEFDVNELNKIMDELDKVSINLRNNLDKNQNLFKEVEKNLQSTKDLESIKNKSISSE